MVPGDGWEFVRPLSRVTVTFDADIDVDSLAGAEVHVSGHGSPLIGGAKQAIEATLNATYGRQERA